MTNQGLRAAVVDDDPIQVEILRGIAESAGLDARVEFKAFHSLSALVTGAGPRSFDVVFLDRRLPDSDGFGPALATLSQAGLKSPIIMMSAHAGRDAVRAYGLKTHGPVDKMELAQPAYLKRLIESVVSPRERVHG